MDLLSNIEQSIASESADKVAELEKETKQLQESNPFKISDKLSGKGFVATYDAIYRLYTINDGVEYYLKIARDSGKKFQLNYAWCIKEDNAFNVVSGIYTSTKTIYENIEKRNQVLGKYTKDYNLPRNETVVADFLNETWKLIIGANGYLDILKDANSEFKLDKYSSNNILQEYVVLSDVVIDNGAEFQLLYAKTESYTIFVHNTNDDKNHVATFSWQDNPIDLLKADESDPKIQLLFEKLQSINPSFDVFKIKDCLFKSIVELDKDMNAKMEILNNASSTIKEVLVDVIATLRTKHFDNLTEKIKGMFSEHKSPSKQMLADYINASDEFFIVHDIKKRFKRTPHGFVEITPRDISNFFNNEFGFNKVSMKRCNECMDYITRELTIDYNIIQFKNGLYDTNKEIFHADKYANQYIPKLNLSHYSYHENVEQAFKETKLYKELQAILETKKEKWQDWNEHIFFKSIGSCYHATNVADKLFVLVGKSGSRKSTLLTIIKRIFNESYCNMKIQQVVKNERFVLVPSVNKAILIDDDASDLQISNIGNLNSFVSGTGLYVEFKNANDGVYLDENNTPRIWCASNELFNVIGSGFKRRLCLIICDKEFDRNKSTKQYMVDINNGERDDELELLISYCLQVYASEKDCAFLTQEQEDLMFDEFEFKSYAERKFVQDVFTYGDEIAEIMEDLQARNETINTIANDDPVNLQNVTVEKWCIEYENSNDTSKVTDDESSDDKDSDKVKAMPKYRIPTILSIKDASTICRKYLRYQKEQGTIFDSQAIPSSKRIKTALEMFGYNQTSKNVNRYGKRTSMRVYENIVIKEDWIQKLKLEKLVENITENDL